jgi:hypothetical protein
MHAVLWAKNRQQSDREDERMITRRNFLKTSTATGLALAGPGVAAPAVAKGAKLRVGYVSPQTGPLAGFAESDAYNIKAFLGSDAGKNFEVIAKDSQSNPNRAAEVAKSLIVDDEINLMLVGSTPETTNPVSTTCEAEGMPVISTTAPWQPWFIGQQGNPGDPASWKPFKFAYHYFWGLEDIIAVYTGMWKQLSTNGKVGGLFPNDADGNAWGDPKNGLKPGLAAAGFTLADPGRYGLHHLLESGAPARPQAQGGDGRQGDSLSAIGRDARRRRQQPFVRGLVVGLASVQVVADRPNFGAARGGFHSQDRPPVDPADRLLTFAV